MTATAVPLPNGMQQFIDGNGAPYANGMVATYIPGGSTPKTTWQDPAQTVPNRNPILLDGTGRAVIWGSGLYRQILTDQYGNTIWDEVTEAADPNFVISLIPNFVGDTGVGGVAGFVPAPPAGSTDAGWYLNASGVWQPLNVVVPSTPANNQAGFLFVPSRTVTTSSAALALSDAGGNVSFSLAGVGELTITNDATALWPNGPVITQIMLSNLIGSGNWTLMPDTGVSLVWPGSSPTPGPRILAANGQALLSRIGFNSWTVVGAGLS